MNSELKYEILRHYLLGSITNEQQQLLDQWLQEDPANQKEFDLLCSHWNTPEPPAYILNQEEIKHELWDKLSDDHHLLDQSRWSFYKMLKVAAVLFVIAISSYVVASMLKSPDQQDEQVSSVVTKSNVPGRKSTINLLDGTQVVLNADSEIQFHEQFNDTARIVWLSGEAYFDVAHNPNLPFYVLTDNIEVQVLGTTFNIRNYPEISDIRVSLSSGKLSVRSKEDEGGVSKYLDPGQQVSFKKTTEEFSKVEQFEPTEVQGWKDGIIYFEKAGFEEIVIRLERWYGVDIQATNTPIADISYTGHFEQENLDNVLTSIGFVLNFTHTINQKNIIVDFK